MTSSGSGTASCANSKLTGTSNIIWNTGQSTSAALAITGAGAVVVVQAASTSGTAFAGLQARAALAFAANPVQCNTTTGVTTASFSGTVRIGHP